MIYFFFFFLIHDNRYSDFYRDIIDFCLGKRSYLKSDLLCYGEWL